jgi:hypothetical protein
MCEGIAKGLEYLRAIVSQAKSELASKGHIPGHILQWIIQSFSLVDYMFVHTCVSEGCEVANRDSRQNDSLVGALDRQLVKIGLFERLAAEREELEGDAEARRLSLRMQPTSFSATKLTWTGSCLAPWTNWSVCSGCVKASACRPLLTSI